MNYKIVGRWNTLNPNQLGKLPESIYKALETYKNDFYYNTSKPVYSTGYNLKYAAEALLAMSPKQEVSIVRVETDSIILVTLAIQVTHLNYPYSSEGCICLEEMINELEKKDPNYYALFLSKLEGAA